MLTIEVPNVNSAHQHPAKRFHYAHVVGFTPESFALAIRRGGWEIVELSLDRHERNLFVVARKRAAGTKEVTSNPAGAGVSLPAPLVSSAAGTVKYYLRPTTYLRWLDRMKQFAGEFRATRASRTPREVVGLVAGIPE